MEQSDSVKSTDGYSEGILQIKHRVTGAVLFEGEYDTIKALVETAVKLGIDLSYADLKYVDLSDTNLKGIKLRYSNLFESNLSGADVSYSDVSYSNLIGVDLRCTDLSCSKLERVKLSKAKLWGTIFNYAILRYANMSGTNMRDTELKNTDLHGVNFRGAIGNMSEVGSMRLEPFNVTFTKDFLQIDCEGHSVEEWKNFSDEEIDNMNSHLLTFWKRWKETIFSSIELSFPTESCR